jgi:UDP:flavonoid glycosyltransferase YjiC (YdhE family)
MRITVLALGSRGDVEPIVALGKALTTAGHRVRVATFEIFRSLVVKAGLDFSLVRGDARALLSSVAENERLARRISPFEAIAALRRSYGSLAVTLPQDVSNLSDTDMVLNQLPSFLLGGDLAEHLRVPWAVLAVIPLARTRFHPLIGFPHGPSSLPGYNLLTYRLGEQLGWQLFRSAINRLRTRSWGLPALPLCGPYENIHRNHVPFIFGFSQHVVPRPPDWGRHIHVTGWWYSDEPKWLPPPELVRFLESGPPPIFIGFGSMPITNPSRVTALVVEAAALAGRRAILHSGWAGLGGRLPATVFPVTEVSYGWLFPRMAAVVHHGGSGTTALSFRSGVPSFIVPFLFDQFYWGARSAELGIGPKPVPFRDLTAKRLAKGIQEAASDSEMRRRAADLGARLSLEDGLQRAVEWIEQL